MSEFQNVKDSVYVALRERLAELNPTRVMTTADGTRPGILVEENEIETVSPLRDEVFAMRWGGCESKDGMVVLTAEIAYRTMGDEAMSRQDRGRRAAAMDEEIFAMCERGNAAIADHTQDPALLAGGKIMWHLAGIEASRESYERRARLVVMFARSGGAE